MKYKQVKRNSQLLKICRQNSQYLQLSDDPCVNETILQLTKLIESGKFGTNNISDSVFQDTLKWHGQTNSSQMRYSDNTKEFFWTGRRLFGGKFIRFMRGFAHRDFVKQGETACPWSVVLSGYSGFLHH